MKELESKYKQYLQDCIDGIFYNISREIQPSIDKAQKSLDANYLEETVLELSKIKDCLDTIDFSKLK